MAARRTALFIVLFFIASQSIDAVPLPYRYDPVTISLTELRQDIRIAPPKYIESLGHVSREDEIESSGILPYKNYLLISEPDAGIHVFDNKNPANPVAVGFLPIPGSNLLAIKNDILYTDSYVDMVLIDLADISNARSIMRITDTFPARFDARTYGLDPDEVVITKFAQVFIGAGVGVQ